MTTISGSKTVLIHIMMHTQDLYSG